MIVHGLWWWPWKAAICFPNTGVLASPAAARHRCNTAAGDVAALDNATKAALAIVGVTAPNASLSQSQARARKCDQACCMCMRGLRLVLAAESSRENRRGHASATSPSCSPIVRQRCACVLLRALAQPITLTVVVDGVVEDRRAKVGQYVRGEQRASHDTCVL